MAFGDLFKDYPSSVERLPTLRPEQLALQNKLLGSAGDILADTGSYKFNFAPIEQRAREQFQTQTVPSLAERFTAGGGQRSSAFQGAVGAAGAGLETNLAALGAEYGLRGQELQQNQLKNLLGYGLTPSFENIYTPQQPGFLKSAAPGILGSAGQLGAQALSGYLANRGQQPIQPGAQAPSAAATMGSSIAGAASPALIAGATTAAKAAGIASSAFLPVLGGFGAAAALAGLGYGIYRLVKRGKNKEAKQLKQQLQQMEQYMMQHPNEFPPDFPKRAKGESLDTWNNRVLQYVSQRQQQAGGQA